MATEFIGFTLHQMNTNEEPIHSSELGLYRVSDGNRYNEELAPTSKDVTVEVPGGDGTYYFGSYFTQRPISISVAFDGMTEKQFRQIRQIIGSRKIWELTFDEEPYKTYRVKPTGNSSLKYICFDEEKRVDGPIESTASWIAMENHEKGGIWGMRHFHSPASRGRRIYKGEGTLTFTAYEPFAHCSKKWLEDYFAVYKVETTVEKDGEQVVEYFYNYCAKNELPEGKEDIGFGSLPSEFWDEFWQTSEWVEAAGLVSETQGYDVFSSGVARLYNPGDIEADWVLITESMPLSLSIDGEIFMKFSGSLEDGEELYLDSKKNLAFSKKDGSDSITLRNDCIESGYWKKIPLEESRFTVEGENTNPSIEYDYLYL